MTKISGTNLSVIKRDMVPEKFRDKYDWVAKDSGDTGLIDTKAELSKFFSQARLTMLNLKASEEEYNQLMNKFADYAKASEKYNTENRLKQLKEQNYAIKAEIAELEKNIKTFEQYKKENPKKSVANNVLNKTELWSKAGITILTIAVTMWLPDDGAIGNALVNWTDKTKVNGAIANSNYNQLRKKADYERLEDLKSALKQNEMLLSACKNRLDSIG